MTSFPMMTQYPDHFSPEMRQMLVEASQLVQLEIVQGLANPDMSRAGGDDDYDPTFLSDVTRRAIAQSAERKDVSAARIEADFYTPEVREMARRWQVDLASDVPVTSQIPLGERFAYVAPQLFDEERLLEMADATFDLDFGSGSDDEEGPTSVTDAAPSADAAPGSGSLMGMIMHDPTRFGTVETLPGARLDPGYRTLPPGGIVVPEARVEKNAHLEFRIHRVHAIDGTDIELPWWHDHIAMGGAAIDWARVSHKIPAFDVKSGFVEGTSKWYHTPNVLHRFPLQGLTYPADFVVSCVLSEIDAGGFSDWMKDFWKGFKKVVDKIIAEVAKVVGAALGSLIGNPKLGAALGAVLGAAVSWLLDVVVGWIVDLLKDDIFTPQSAALRLPAPSTTFPGGQLVSPRMKLTFKDLGGHYTVTYSWKLVR